MTEPFGHVGWRPEATAFSESSIVDNFVYQKGLVLTSQQKTCASDNLLMEAVINRKEDALECIHKRYESLLRTVILGVTRDRSEMEEILDEVLLQVWEQGDRYNPNAQLPFSDAEQDLTSVGLHVNKPINLSGALSNLSVSPEIEDRWEKAPVDTFKNVHKGAAVLGRASLTKQFDGHRRNRQQEGNQD